MAAQTFVIVGAGPAGAKAAETLREEGFDGRFVLIGAEAQRPYERPPLSKDYLRGEAEAKPYVHDESFYAEHDIELRTSTTVERIDPASSEVSLAGDETLRYDRLLLATGARPRGVAVPGAELDGVLTLRTIEDSEAIRARVDAGGRLVTIGAGWIGAEVAASARQRGCDVTILEMAKLPLERVLGAELGAVCRDIHTDNRIVVDEHLQTSAPGIFAAGDVANAQHPFYGTRIRVEHWANALNQGPAAARNMLSRGEAYDRIPYFFSDQYDVGMEYAGYATAWDEVVFHGDPKSREFIAFWLKDKRVVAGMNVNVWDVNEHIQALVRARHPIDPRRLGDPDIPLEDLLAPSRSAS